MLFVDNILIILQAIAFREYETACEQSRACSRAVVGIQKIKCIRECMSSACYREIYSRDPVNYLNKINA